VPVSEALGLGMQTIYRLLKRYQEGGVGALPGLKGRRMPTKVRGAKARQLIELRERGVSYREAARRIGVSLTGAYAATRRLGPTRKVEVPASLPETAERAAEDEAVSESGDSQPCPIGVSEPVVEGSHELQSAVPVATASSAPAVVSGSPTEKGAIGPGVSTDTDPLCRQGDRLMARLGLLEDAAPLFAPGVVPDGGVLLAVPLLFSSGIFEIAPEVYGDIGPAFYGLRTSVLAFLLMALLRIKRPENLKEVAPHDLGRVLGLDRSPEMKTLRGKLKELAAREKSLEFMRLLAHRRSQEHSDVQGFLYIDGHVRVYSGKAKLSKAYVMQRRLALPGTTDYWVNDQAGQPLLVVTAEANEGLTKMLLPVLKEVRTAIGDHRGATIVFDRGGWSPKLFRAIITDGWDILTYRKGKTLALPRKAFQEHEGTIQGHPVKYQLADKHTQFLSGKLKLRQVTVLGEDSYQMNILTNREDVPALEVAYRMFDRWRQENYFKYMEEEFALDALVEYGAEDADPNRMVPSPERKAIDRELNDAKADLAKLERTYGAAAFDNKEDRRRTMRGFKIATGGTIGRPLREAREKVQAILERRKFIPPRVAISVALKSAPVRLREETKRLSDTFKMVAYQTETALVDLLRPHYRRTEHDGRTLVATALKTPATLSLHEGELRVTLAALSTPHWTRAIQAVCEELNKIGACFPGSPLRLRYDVADCANVAMAAEG
jgi:transposase